MKKNCFIVSLLFLAPAMHAQITILGHNQINGQPLTNCQVLVVDGAQVTHSLSTMNRPDFTLQLDFGKTYRIYFRHKDCPVMYMQVDGTGIPREKYEYRMSYELNIPFVYKFDEDIDTAQFAEPFHKVLYNGMTRMVDDSTYNNNFSRQLVKRNSSKSRAPGLETEPVYTGKILLANRPAANVSITALDENQRSVKTTTCNRQGIFVFVGLGKQVISGFKLNKTDSTYSEVTLTDPNGEILKKQSGKNELRLMLTTAEMSQLNEPFYTSEIGGKMVISSSRDKRFFANKTVYLLNKHRTVIDQTKTNIIGTFVFPDIKPEHLYYISVDKSELQPGEKVDLLSKDDKYIATLDQGAGQKAMLQVHTAYNTVFNALSVDAAEMKMDIKATIFGDNVNNPIGRLKIVLLNDNYEVIDSTVTDNFGTFKFIYLPFLKRFYLSAENNDNVLDVFKNILIYSSDDNLIKVMTHQKGHKFSYKPLSAEISRMSSIELSDPWLEFIDDKQTAASPGFARMEEGKKKLIVENIFFENNQYVLTTQAREVLDKVILVLDNNRNLKIEVGAHTDNKGGATANQRLSELRAKAVKDYIVGAGISNSRISAVGYGESKPKNNCGNSCNEAQHAENRRIEFIILGDQSN